MEITALIAALTNALAGFFEDEPVIALAGAHAKGVADAHSDLDLYLFGDRPKPYEARRELAAALCDAGSTPFVTKTLDQPWGGSADFTFRGVPVETVLRTKAQTDLAVDRALSGAFEIIPQCWTSNGYYTYIVLSELQFLKPIRDPDGWLAAVKKRTAVYPEPLRTAVIDRFFARAGTWLGNFHYASAIEREDILFAAPAVLHTLLDLIQVIFAVNRRYYPGDKKLEAALRSLPYCPQTLLANLELLLSYPKDRQVLHRQADILARIHRELREKVKSET